MNRRRFLRSSLALSVAPAGAALAASKDGSSGMGPHLRLSCNLYSFNAPLRSGEMSVEEVVDYCAELGFDAVDPTAYYLWTYPAVPPDALLYRLKRQCVLLGLEISGTGVRNDFTVADPNARAADVALVQAWIDAAQRLGAPQVRVFAGHALPDTHSREEIEDWMVEDLKACCAYGAERGIFVSVQNHAAFLRTADEVLRLRERVDSDWFGLILDVGSFRGTDTYADIARLAPLATSWQLKENLTVDGQVVRTDVPRLIEIIRDSGYRGYLPIETLGEGDPKVKVARFLDEVQSALG